MEIYRLDDFYVRTDVIDEFESFIWTERYSEAGDFEIVTRPSVLTKRVFKEGAFITHSETNRVMIVEEIEKAKDEDDTLKLFIKGRSLEILLDTRVTAPAASAPEWTKTGPTGVIVKDLVQMACVSGSGFYVNEVIPQLGAYNDVIGGESIDASIKPQSLYKAVKDLCDAAKLGFKIVLEKESPTLRFRVYEGKKRNNVVFSSDLDNLEEESYLTSRSNYYNVAVVWSKDASDRVWVTAPGVTSPRGLQRRVLSVDAGDIDPAKHTVSELQSMLKQRGKEELAKHEKITIFDGKLTEFNPHVYNRHYNLGDTVTLLGDDDEKQETVVTEYIWAWDQEGLRSYPTFKVKDEEE